MKKLLTLVRTVNMYFVSVILLLTYIIVIPFIWILYKVTDRQSKTTTSSYWTTESMNKPLDIESAY